MTGELPATSLHEELSAGFDAISAPNAAPAADAPPAAASDAPPAVDGQPAPLLETTPWEAPPMWGQKYRDTAGRFASNPEYRELLDTWRDHWKENQGYTTKREQELADVRRRYDPIGEIIAPYEQYWAQQGLRPEQGVGQIFSYAKALAEDPTSTLLQLADMYGVDLQSAFAEQPYVDPTVKALQAEIAELKQAQQSFGTTQQQAQQQRLMQEVQSFAEGKDEQGNPRAPHFDRVFDRMIGLARGGLVQNIQDAYDMAVTLDKDLQAEIQTKAAQSEAAQKAALAKKALGASQTVQGKSTIDGPPPTMSLRDELLQGFESLGSQ